jgi:3-oxoacyl-[acyl-carrier protein] reductase
MESGLAGKLILITGASGGIGSATARAFAREGARLVLHYRENREAVRRLQSEVDPQGTRSLVVRADLTRESQVERLWSRVDREMGPVDSLIANAGSWETRDVPMQAMSLTQWRSTLDSVLTSTFLSTRAFLQRVQRQRRGNVVLVGSTAGVFGEAGHADYASAKAAIAYGLLRTLKNELPRIAPHTEDYCGGRINCVCPGWTVVPRNAAKLRDQAVVRKVTATMSLPQIGRPEDMAHAIVFLSSDLLARHVTGQTLVVAGGMEGRWLWQPSEVNPLWA